MSIYRSTGLVNYVAAKGSVKDALQNCRILLFSGAQPTSADTGASSSPLVVLTANSAAYTAEVLPQWKFTLIGSAGSVDSIKIGGVEQLVASVPYNTSITQTCYDIATMINANGAIPDYQATVTGVSNDEVVIYGPINSGTQLNALVLTVTASGGFTTSLTNAGAISVSGANAIGGGTWQYTPSEGVLSKTSTVWSGTILSTGTASWFMIVTDSDTGTSSSTVARRIIGSVATSGADLNLSSATLTAGASVSINSWTLTVTR